MSKISEKNSVKQKKKYLLRPWGELVTDLYLRFRRDIFFSTRIKIVFFHILSVVCVIGAMVWLNDYVRKVTLLAVVHSLDVMVHGGTSDPSAFLESDETVRMATLTVYVLTAFVSILVGVISSSLALRPVRTTLIMQKRFIASIAHELRTPLTILITQNEVAKLDVDPDSPVAEILEQNIQEVNHMAEILNNLLLFNRVDTFESISFEATDLGKVIETVIGRLTRLAERKGVKLSVGTEIFPEVYANPTALEQALSNVIKNAIDYTKKGGTVSIVCTEQSEREVTLKIADTGIGISPKDLAHIFEPFFRSESGQEEGMGTGLGLAIVFEIVKLHNGKINVESAVGEGTRFQITIPRLPGALSIMDRDKGVKVAYDFTKEKRTR